MDKGRRKEGERVAYEAACTFRTNCRKMIYVSLASVVNFVLLINMAICATRRAAAVLLPIPRKPRAASHFRCTLQNARKSRNDFSRDLIAKIERNSSYANIAALRNVICGYALSAIAHTYKRSKPKHHVRGAQ